MHNPFEEIIERLERIETILVSQANHAAADRLERSNKERNRLTRKQLADKINVHVSTIDVWANKGILVRYKQGGRFFFYEDEALNAYIKIEK